MDRGNRKEHSDCIRGDRRDHRHRAVLIDGGFPKDVRRRLVNDVRSEFDKLDRQGIKEPRIVEAEVGAEARGIGGASLPIFKPLHDRSKRSDQRTCLTDNAGQPKGPADTGPLVVGWIDRPASDSALLFRLDRLHGLELFRSRGTFAALPVLAVFGALAVVFATLRVRLGDDAIAISIMIP